MCLADDRVLNLRNLADGKVLNLAPVRVVLNEMIGVAMFSKKRIFFSQSSL